MRRHHRLGLGWSLLLIACVFAAWILLGEKRQQDAARPDTEFTGARDSGDRTPEEVLAAPTSGELGRTSVAQANDTEVDLAFDDLEALERWLSDLRELAARERFHAPAWPIVHRLGSLLSGTRSESHAIARIVQVVGDPGEFDRVRGACLIALQLGELHEEAALLARSNRDLSGTELERAAWLVLALSNEGEPGMAIPLEGFLSATGLETFPMTLKRIGTLEPGLDRIQADLPEYFRGDPSEKLGLRKAESFTRELVLLSQLGPATKEPAQRDRMLAWIRSRSLHASVVRDAALHCLALSAREDDDLAETLLAIAQEQLFQRHPSGAEILTALSRIAQRHNLVLETLEHFFRNPSRSDDPLSAVGQAQAMDALIPLLASRDATLAEHSVEIVMERVLDENTDPLERSLFLEILAQSGNAALLDVARLVTQSFTDQEALQDAIQVLNRVREEDRSAAHALLVDLDAREELAPEVRRAILREMNQIGTPEAKAYLRSRLESERDPALRELLEELLGE